MSDEEGFGAFEDAPDLAQSRGSADDDNPAGDASLNVLESKEPVPDKGSLSADEEDDDWGDFGDADAEAAPEPASKEAPAAFPPMQPVPEPTEPSADILALKSPEFASAVRASWNILGAEDPDIINPVEESELDQCRHPMVALEGSSSIVANNGLPLDLSNVAHGAYEPTVKCDVPLQWKGTDSERRLLTTLGLADVAAQAKEEEAAEEEAARQRRAQVKQGSSGLKTGASVGASLPGAMSKAGSAGTASEGVDVASKGQDQGTKQEAAAVAAAQQASVMTTRAAFGQLPDGLGQTDPSTPHSDQMEGQAGNSKEAPEWQEQVLSELGTRKTFTAWRAEFRDYEQGNGSPDRQPRTQASASNYSSPGLAGTQRSQLAAPESGSGPLTPRSKFAAWRAEMRGEDGGDGGGDHGGLSQAQMQHQLSTTSRSGMPSSSNVRKETAAAAAALSARSKFAMWKAQSASEEEPDGSGAGTQQPGSSATTSAAPAPSGARREVAAPGALTPRSKFAAWREQVRGHEDDDKGSAGVSATLAVTGMQPQAQQQPAHDAGNSSSHVGGTVRTEAPASAASTLTPCSKFAAWREEVRGHEDDGEGSGGATALPAAEDVQPQLQQPAHGDTISNDMASTEAAAAAAAASTLSKFAAWRAQLRGQEHEEAIDSGDEAGGSKVGGQQPGSGDGDYFVPVVSAVLTEPAEEEASAATFVNFAAWRAEMRRREKGGCASEDEEVDAKDGSAGAQAQAQVPDSLAPEGVVAVTIVEDSNSAADNAPPEPVNFAAWREEMRLWEEGRGRMAKGAGAAPQKEGGNRAATNAAEHPSSSMFAAWREEARRREEEGGGDDEKDHDERKASGLAALRSRYEAWRAEMRKMEEEAAAAGDGGGSEQGQPQEPNSGCEEPESVGSSRAAPVWEAQRVLWGLGQRQTYIEWRDELRKWEREHGEVPLAMLDPEAAAEHMRAGVPGGTAGRAFVPPDQALPIFPHPIVSDKFVIPDDWLLGEEVDIHWRPRPASPAAGGVGAAAGPHSHASPESAGTSSGGGALGRTLRAACKAVDAITATAAAYVSAIACVDELSSSTAAALGATHALTPRAARAAAAAAAAAQFASRQLLRAVITVEEGGLEAAAATATAASCGARLAASDGAAHGAKVVVAQLAVAQGDEGRPVRLRLLAPTELQEQPLLSSQLEVDEGDGEACVRLTLWPQPQQNLRQELQPAPAPSEPPSPLSTAPRVRLHLQVLAEAWEAAAAAQAQEAAGDSGDDADPGADSANGKGAQEEPAPAVVDELFGALWAAAAPVHAAGEGEEGEEGEAVDALEDPARLLEGAFGGREQPQPQSSSSYWAYDSYPDPLDELDYEEAVLRARAVEEEACRVREENVQLAAKLAEGMRKDCFSELVEGVAEPPPPPKPKPPSMFEQYEQEVVLRHLAWVAECERKAVEEKAAAAAAEAARQRAQAEAAAAEVVAQVVAVVVRRVLVEGKAREQAELVAQVCDRLYPALPQQGVGAAAPQPLRTGSSSEANIEVWHPSFPPCDEEVAAGTAEPPASTATTTSTAAGQGSRAGQQFGGGTEEEAGQAGMGLNDATPSDSVRLLDAVYAKEAAPQAGAHVFLVSARASGTAAAATRGGSGAGRRPGQVDVGIGALTAPVGGPTDAWSPVTRAVGGDSTDSPGLCGLGLDVAADEQLMTQAACTARAAVALCAGPPPRGHPAAVSGTDPADPAGAPMCKVGGTVVMRPVRPGSSAPLHAHQPEGLAGMGGLLAVASSKAAGEGPEAAPGPAPAPQSVLRIPVQSQPAAQPPTRPPRSRHASKSSTPTRVSWTGDAEPEFITLVSPVRMRPGEDYGDWEGACVDDPVQLVGPLTSDSGSEASGGAVEEEEGGVVPWAAASAAAAAKQQMQEDDEVVEALAKLLSAGLVAPEAVAVPPAILRQAKARALSTPAATLPPAPRTRAKPARAPATTDSQPLPQPPQPSVDPLADLDPDLDKFPLPDLPSAGAHAAAHSGPVAYVHAPGDAPPPPPCPPGLKQVLEGPSGAYAFHELVVQGLVPEHGVRRRVAVDHTLAAAKAAARADPPRPYRPAAAWLPQPPPPLDLEALAAPAASAPGTQTVAGGGGSVSGDQGDDPLQELKPELLDPRVSRAALLTPHATPSKGKGVSAGSGAPGATSPKEWLHTYKEKEAAAKGTHGAPGPAAADAGDCFVDVDPLRTHTSHSLPSSAKHAPSTDPFATTTTTTATTTTSKRKHGAPMDPFLLPPTPRSVRRAPHPLPAPTPTAPSPMISLPMPPHMGWGAGVGGDTQGCITGLHHQHLGADGGQGGGVVPPPGTVLVPVFVGPDGRPYACPYPMPPPHAPGVTWGAAGATGAAAAGAGWQGAPHPLASAPNPAGGAMPRRLF